MRLLTNFPRLCFIMVLLSIVGLCIAQGDPHMLLWAGALAAISWYVTEGPRGKSLPRWVSNVLVIGITLHVLFDWIQAGGDVLESVSRFALLLTLIKLYERRTPRDHAQLMLLSFLLMVIASLQTFALLFGVILLAYALLGLYVLVLYQLYAAHDQVRRNRLESIPEAARFTPSTKPIIGRSPALHFRTLVVGLGVAGFILSIFAFIAFPRGVGDSAFADLGRAGTRAVTGFSESVDLLHGRRINESRREVMRVQLLDEDGHPRRAPSPVLLLKGSVLDSYEGQGRWRRANRSWSMGHITDGEFRPVPPRRMSDDAAWTMRVRGYSDSRTVFTIGRPISLRIDTPRTLEFDQQTGEIRGQPEHPPIRAYELQFDFGEKHFSPRARYGFPDPSWQYPLRRLHDDRVAELARQILDEAGLPAEPPSMMGDPVGDRVGEDKENSGMFGPLVTTMEKWQWRKEAAQAFERFLRSPRFTYSLDLSHIVHSAVDGEDPIVNFLLDHRRGQCEYFASAMMALCYNAGIEARLVAGYLAASFDRASQEYKVLELNAHAWVEVRTGEHVWRTFDPTPQQVIGELHVPETTRADRLRWIYDRFDMLWNRTFIRYDSQIQTELAEQWDFGMGERAHAVVERVKHWINELHRMFRFRPATYLWLGLIGFAIILASLIGLQLLKRMIKLRDILRLRHVHGREYQRMLRQLGFYLDMLTVLDRANVSKPPWQPPMQYAEQLARTHPDEAAIVQQVSDGFYRARYGHRALSPDELRELRKGVQSLAERFGVRL